MVEFGRKQLRAKRGVSEGMFCFELKEKRMEMGLGLVLCMCYFGVRLGQSSLLPRTIELTLVHI